MLTYLFSVISQKSATFHASFPEPEPTKAHTSAQPTRRKWKLPSALAASLRTAVSAPRSVFHVDASVSPYLGVDVFVDVPSFLECVDRDGAAPGEKGISDVIAAVMSHNSRSTHTIYDTRAKAARGRDVSTRVAAAARRGNAQRATRVCAGWPISGTPYAFDGQGVLRLAHEVERVTIKYRGSVLVEGRKERMVEALVFDAVPRAQAMGVSVLIVSPSVRVGFWQALLARAGIPSSVLRDTAAVRSLLCKMTPGSVVLLPEQALWEDSAFGPLRTRSPPKGAASMVLAFVSSCRRRKRPRAEGRRGTAARDESVFWSVRWGSVVVDNARFWSKKWNRLSPPVVGKIVAAMHCADLWEICRPCDSVHPVFARLTGVHVIPPPDAIRSFLRRAVVRGPETLYLSRAKFSVRLLHAHAAELAAHRAKMAAHPRRRQQLLRDACFASRGCARAFKCFSAAEWNSKSECAEPWHRSQLGRAGTGVQCVICWTENSDVLFLPCGHLACANCTKKIPQCMLCRAPLRMLACVTDAGGATRSAEEFSALFCGPKISLVVGEAERRRQRGVHLAVTSAFPDVNSIVAEVLRRRGYHIKRIHGTARRVEKTLSEWETPSVVIGTPQELAATRIPCDLLIALHPFDWLLRRSASCRRLQDLLWALDGHDNEPAVHILCARGTVDETFAADATGVVGRWGGQEESTPRREMAPTGDEPEGQERVASRFAKAALGRAAAAGNASAARTAVLLDGANVNAAVFDAGGGTTGTCTAAYVAALFGHVGVLVVLLAAGADPNKGDTGDGSTPLHVAMQGKPRACSVLLARGADPNRANEHGVTPCMIGAARCGAPNERLRCLRALAGGAAQQGAALDVAAAGTGGVYEGTTALDIALAAEDDEVAAYLRLLLAGAAPSDDLSLPL